MDVTVGFWGPEEHLMELTDVVRHMITVTLMPTVFSIQVCYYFNIKLISNVNCI